MSEIRQSTAGGGGGEEGNQLSRGLCAGPSRSQLQAYSASVRKSLTHARERGERRVPDWDLIERAPSGSCRSGTLFMMARRD
jgi:hypothetical protein